MVIALDKVVVDVDGTTDVGGGILLVTIVAGDVVAIATVGKLNED